MISHSVGSLPSFILMLKFPEVWSAGVPSRQLLYPFDLPPIILLSSSFFSGATRCSKLIFYLLFSRLEISHVFKELLFVCFQWELVFQNQDLNAGCLHSLLPVCHCSRSFQVPYKRFKNMYFRNYEFIIMPPVLILPHSVLPWLPNWNIYFQNYWNIYLFP